MELTQWGASEWAAFGAVGAVVVYIVLGWIALWQLAETRRLRELEHRPYVLIDFFFRGQRVMLELRNIGRTPARNVEVHFDKPLVAADSNRAYRFGIFDAPIPMIAPQRTIHLPLGSGPAFFAPEARAPLSYSVTMSYDDMTGKKRYKDPPLLLDLSPYKHTIPPRDSGGEVANSMKEIQRTLKGWSSFDGLMVTAVDRHQQNRSHERWDHYFDAKRILRAAGVRALLRYEKQRVLRKLS